MRLLRCKGFKVRVAAHDSGATFTPAWALEAVARERWLFGTSPPNSYWYSGALAWLVEIAKPL